ncbi:hypothetical protein H072_3438 [Dactylellina haptotyla CBS 200.50]|uniref:G-protein coupled receptors family 1 profile domain-containing protein n=1 Tax=Dactylellina haptotyla (strain CBS 200.50) TaxID=1284197 RepID=S8AI50_DACHA|nr:hypothetical protein H072_3438 [Dactylellina haptotyla CBS 200.50]
MTNLFELIESHSFHLSVILLTILIEVLYISRDYRLSTKAITSNTNSNSILIINNVSIGDIAYLETFAKHPDMMTTKSEPYIFAICCFSSIILLIIPFIWQVRKRNLAAAILVFWLQSDLLLSFINALIWPTWVSVVTGWQGKGYCDFVVKWKIAAEFGGINACVFCVMITIYRMFVGVGMYRESKKSKRTRMLYEWTIGGLFPVILAGLHYVVQPNRYYLTPVYGCHPPIDNSWVSLIIVGWPFVFSSSAAVLVFMIVHKMKKHLAERNLMGFLTSTHTIDSGFRRLYMMVTLFLVIYWPTNLYGVVSFCMTPMLPYDWGAVHADWWGTIYKFPDNQSFQYQRWIKVIAGWALFLIFGRGAEAEFIYWDLAKTFGVSRQVQLMVWKYRLFKQHLKTTWIPKITPKWIYSIQSTELPLGGFAGAPARRKWGLATFVKWVRQKLGNRGGIHLDTENSSKEVTSTIESTPKPLTVGYRLMRAFRRIGRPHIHFEFNITWIRESVYNVAPHILNFSRYRIDAAELDPPFITTFDATTLEKIAQQAGKQVNAEARQHKSIGSLDTTILVASQLKENPSKPHDDIQKPQEGANIISPPPPIPEAEVIRPSRPMGNILGDIRVLLEQRSREARQERERKTVEVT